VGKLFGILLCLTQKIKFLNFECGFGYIRNAGCCEGGNITQGLGQVLLNGAPDTVMWQAIMRIVMLLRALEWTDSFEWC
jgi:hypothetical protein